MAKKKLNRLLTSGNQEEFMAAMRCQKRVSGQQS